MIGLIAINFFKIQIYRIILGILLIKHYSSRQFQKIILNCSQQYNGQMEMIRFKVPKQQNQKEKSHKSLTE